MRLIAVIANELVARRILQHLGLVTTDDMVFKIFVSPPTAR